VLIEIIVPEDTTLEVHFLVAGVGEFEPFASRVGHRLWIGHNLSDDDSLHRLGLKPEGCSSRVLAAVGCDGRGVDYFRAKGAADMGCESPGQYLRRTHIPDPSDLVVSDNGAAWRGNPCSKVDLRRQEIRQLNPRAT